MSNESAEMLRIYADQIARKGETIIVRRQGSPNIDVSARARVSGYQAERYVGSKQQAKRMFIVLAVDLASFPWPIQERKDRILWNGKVLTINNFDDSKRRVSGVPIAYEIFTEGA